MAIPKQNIFQAAPDGLAKRPAEASEDPFEKSDGALLTGYVAFALTMLTAIYFGSMSPGTSPADFAAMSVFP
jgi:hypothetical protein